MLNPEPRSPNPSACPEDVSAGLVPGRRALIDNLPYIAMILLGAVIFRLSVDSATWQGVLAEGYVAYGALGAFWIMVFVCPYCHFHGTTLCPCGYGWIAAKLRSKKESEDFAGRFKRHIPVIVPLWFLPPVAGGMALYGAFSWTLLILLAAFAVNSYVLLPLVSKRYGCASCPQKDTCPWMGGCR
jgi:hypothetical protein